ncbi:MULTISPECIES: hypothetical protein [unclassified Flavobacterium]|jgi:hypothetical protein|uniref:hypothetical protein n=1 Tax=unclassified Flavobacterium TaxID=196869 RepID=UPI0025C0C588|nr:MULTISPECIES: hypothetical protein [unclassified Flavobacterium]
MSNEIKITDSSADSVRLVGRLVLIAGIILLIISQVMEVSIDDYENIDAKTLLEIPKKIADKTNFTLLGGLLTIVGLQLSLVSNQVITEIKEQFKNPRSTENIKEGLVYWEDLED